MFVMKRTIHFPDDLAAEMAAYLQAHPNETWSGLVQKSIRRFLQRKDPSRLLKLAGIIEDGAPSDLSINEDAYH